MKRLIPILLLFVAMWLTSCHSDTVFSEFQAIPTKEWSVDVKPQFDYTITDAEASYNIVLYVRHTERYPYQNMWLFVNNPHRIDPIEFYLAVDYLLGTILLGKLSKNAIGLQYVGRRKM